MVSLAQVGDQVAFDCDSEFVFGSMVKRWAAASLLAAEKSFRRIMGHKDLWMLEAALKEDIDNQEKAA